MTSPSTRRPTALVTGASSGIGEALAHCFTGAGHDLVLVARSAGKLKTLSADLEERYGVKVRVEPVDLTEPDAAQRLVAKLGRARVAVDVLVNSAGVLSQGAFVSQDEAAVQQMISLNIAGLTAMLSAFVPPMVARGTGRVLNVASIAAFQPIPSLATYAASKAYVLSLTESLSEELRGSGVTVTALCPGITATRMLDTAAEANARVAQIPGLLIGDVQEVARDGFNACMKGEVICVPGMVNQVAMLASRSTPRALLRRVTGLLGRRIL